MAPGAPGEVWLDPQVAEALALLPHTALADVGDAGLRALRESSRVPLDPALPTRHGLVHEDHERWCVLRPAAAGSGPLPVLLHLHGGGLVVGDRHAGLERPAAWAGRHGAAVVSVDYRLAPEHPWPAAHDDAWAALAWVGAQPDLDPDRVVLVGTSAGGGLAAGLLLRARDEGGPAVAAAMLLAPMLDDRSLRPSRALRHDGMPWDPDDDRVAWRSYLGEDPRSGVGGPDVPPYAAPGRVADGPGAQGGLDASYALDGLPPLFLEVGGAELFRDDVVAWAAAAARAGVPVELHVWPGGCHGFTLFADTVDVAASALRAQDDWLARVLDAG